MSKTNFKVQELGNNKFRITLEVPLANKWYDDVYFVCFNQKDTFTYKVGYKNKDDKTIYFETEVEIPDSALYQCYIRCTVDGKNYVLTCYMPVDKSKDVVVDSRYPDITAHPGEQKVQGYHQYGSSVSNGIVEFSRNLPYDMKVLEDMNKTGNLNATYFQQTFAPTYMDAIDAIDARDMDTSLNRLADKWGL